jgi:hypothetical protein
MQPPPQTPLKYPQRLKPCAGWGNGLAGRSCEQVGVRVASRPELTLGLTGGEGALKAGRVFEASMDRALNAV